MLRAFHRLEAEPLSLLYVWVGLYGFYFISMSWGILQSMLVGLAYTAVPPQDPMGSALVTGTVLVSGTLVAILRDRLTTALRSERRSAAEVGSSLSLLEATLESTADGILVVDAAGKMVRLNQKFVEMWRIPEPRDRGEKRRARDRLCPEAAEAAPEQFLKKVADLYADPGAESYDILEFKDGRVFERYSKPQLSEDEVAGRVWSFRDITDRDRFESELLYLADHDVLTGLFNRRRFEQDVARQVAYAARYGTGGAVLLLDLDDFKDVNDTLGHRAGDQLIHEVAQLLAARLRSTDVVARLGGDEFAVLLPEADEEDAADDRAGAARGDPQSQVLLQRSSPGVTASVGIAMVNDVDDGGEDEPLGRADVAMYEAKESGRDRFAVYVSQAHRDSMEAKLDDDRPHPRGAGERPPGAYCQPILDLRTGRISQYELLLRMTRRRESCFRGVPRSRRALRADERHRPLGRASEAIGLVAESAEAGRDLHSR